MRQLADGVWQLGLPPYVVNAYLVEDVLIDAGLRLDGGRILRQLRGHGVNAHALTHAHPDHQGASRQVCEELGIPFWVGEQDADAAEDPRLMAERMARWRIAANQVVLNVMRLSAGPGHGVDRRLAEGDEVAGFEVLEAPGHTAGHLAFWRASDRVLILGDVVANVDILSGRPGLMDPPSIVSADPARNRASARRLGELEPELVCFGHGSPLRDGEKFADYVGGL